MLLSTWRWSSVGVSPQVLSATPGLLGLIASLLVTLLPVLPACSQERLPVLVGTVIKIVDGDTIDVLLDSGPIRIRMHAIDTPERGQPGWREATDALSALVARKRVEIEPFEQDRYDRLVARVYVDGYDVNATLIQQGYAWALRKYMATNDAPYCTLEHEARSAKRGLWALPAGQRIAPWEWRRRKSQSRFTDYADETVARCVAAIGRS